uniref:Uncharacterized protein n=1 Tax=Anguilla anguilla TaxID=7936 RepID=A0A0E9SMB1_ANGAN
MSRTTNGCHYCTQRKTLASNDGSEGEREVTHYPQAPRLFWSVAEPKNVSTVTKNKTRLHSIGNMTKCLP